MAQKLNTVTPNIKPADTENPDGSFRDKSKIYPGSPALAGFNNSTYSFFRKLMTVAELDYNGQVDTTALSQYYNALSSIIDRDIKVITDPLGSRVSVNEGAIENLEGLVSSNANAISSNSGSISTLSGRITSNDDDIATLDGRVTSNDGDISTLQSRVTSNDGDISTLDGRVTSNDGELSTLNSRVNQGVKSTDSPTFENITITGMTGTVESRIEGNASDITGLDTRLDTAESDITTLEGLTPDQEVNTDSDVSFKLVSPSDGVEVSHSFQSVGVNGSVIYPNFSDLPETKVLFARGGFTHPTHGTLRINAIQKQPSTSIIVFYCQKVSNNEYETISIGALDTTAYTNIAIYV